MNLKSLTSLNFTTPKGTQARIFGITYIPNKHTIAYARMDNEIVNLLFDKHDNLLGVKYNHEEIFRKKL